MESQSDRSRIKQLKDFGFRITWTLLKIGYYGDDNIPSLFTKKDISMYAMEELENENKILVAMLLCAENDDYEFDEILNQLCRHEHVSTNLEMRKLRVLFVSDTLKNLPEDYATGLMELTEVWVSLGIPDDCPHIIQGCHNSLTPEEYYTQAMYDILKKKNLDWLNEEIKDIIDQQ